MLGGSVYCLTAAALFSLGIGTLLRSTAATVTVALTVLLLPGTLGFVAIDWVQTIVSYLPLSASSTLLTTGTTDVPSGNLSTHASLVVVAAYAVVPIVAAALALRRRDA